MTLTIPGLFVRSNEALAHTVAQISDDQWDLDLPPGLSRLPSTLLQAINYHVWDDAWVPDVLAGKTADEVGDQYETLKALDRSEVLAEYARYNVRANDSARSFDDLDRTVHLSYGDFPAHEYFRHVIAFRALRAYSVAKLIGADTTLPPDVVDGLWEHLAPSVESYRAIGIFPAPLAVADDADQQTKFLALVGRD